MKPFEEMDDWQKAEHLDGLAASIRVNGAQHHEAIQRVLCGRCSYGLVYRQRSGNQPVTVICNRNDHPLRVPADIEECSQFDPKHAQTISMEDLVKQALTIDVREAPPSKNTYL